MNAFAKYLFQAMFSWVRNAIQQLSDPNLIDSWLAANWLAALIPLLLKLCGKILPTAKA